MKLVNWKGWRFERLLKPLSFLVTFCNTCSFTPDYWLDSVKQQHFYSFATRDTLRNIHIKDGS